jgi:hypothetical protein
MMRRATATACGAAVALVASFGFAQAPPPAERSHVYSPYEQQTIDEVMASLHTTLDPAPEGKTIEQVDVVPLDVFEKRDPLPRWLNVFHATTRPSIVRREMLLREGDRYKQVLSDDTIRNLRSLPQLSVVLVITVLGRSPDRVRVVVITKDVWSLRANWDIEFAPSIQGRSVQGLELLELQPAEWNVAGVHQTASGLFILEPSAYTAGVGYQIPRIDGSRIALVADADVVINRASHSPEGTAGELITGQPIYSGLTKWAWDASVAWQDVIDRRYQNGALAPYVDPATGLSVPFQYRDREYAAAYHVTRSFGWEVKHDLTFGAGVSTTAFRTDFPGADPRTVADFVAANVPVDNNRVGPSIEYHTYTKRYARLLDFESLALQEDVGLGHDVVLRFYPSFRALGSTLDLYGIYAAAGYTFALRDGLFRVAVASTTEPDPDRIYDASITPTAHLVTPTVAGIGRLVVDGTMLYRWRDGLNITGACPGQSIWGPFAPCTTFLGGTDRLRGFPTNFFVGGPSGAARDFVAYNVEFRSRPVEVLTCQIAGVAFYDAGDAFDGFSSLRPFQSVGFGLRALFPWLDREVFSADIGFPVERPIDPATGAPIAGYGFLISFGQAFAPPSVALPSVLPTGQSSW